MSFLASEKAVSTLCESLFYLTDTLFAVIKAIHKTPVAIIRLRIVVILFETGVKVVDLLTPYEHGGLILLRGKILSADPCLMYQSLFACGESEVTLVFGQMNETPGARMRVSHGALAMGEYFRDAFSSDVLIFIDNVFRFLQAGSEVSTLLGRIPSAVGYQPTLSTEMGSFQERICGRSSRQALKGT